MNQNNQQNDIFDLKDIFFVILKKIVFVLLIGFIFAVVGFCYKYFSSFHEVDNSDIVNIFNVSIRLDDETDVEYSRRVQNVNRANDLINTIDALNIQIENNRKYTSDSLFMQIDSECEAITRTNLIVTVDGSQNISADSSLLSSYKQFIQTGDFLDDLADEWDINQSYISDLIKADYVSSSSTVVVNSTNKIDNVGIVTISVIGSSTEQTERIMDIILDNVDIKCAELNTTMVKHTVISEGRQSSYIVDNTTRDRQTTITNRFESLQTQIKNCDKALDDVAAALGVKKDRLYSYFSFNDIENTKSSSQSLSAIKFAIVFFAAGFVIVVMAIVIKYLFCKKFSTQSKFFSRYNWIKKLGVLKPTKKRSRFEIFIDNKTGDDNYLSEENSIKLLSANIKNMIADMNNVMVTGTAEHSRIEDLIKRLDVDVDVKNSFFVDPSSLSSLSKYDGIIIIEQRDYSDLKLIDEELSLINNTHAKLIGAIII